MNTTQLNNIISYYLLMKSDSNFTSHISYIVEKYNIFFTEKPNKINIENHWSKTCKDMVFFINFDKVIKTWNINNVDENFDIYYFTYYLIYYSSSVPKNRTDILNTLLTICGEFFNDNYITKNNLSEVLHPILRNELIPFQNENHRLYKLIYLKDKIKFNRTHNS